MIVKPLEEKLIGNFTKFYKTKQNSNILNDILESIASMKNNSFL